METYLNKNSPHSELTCLRFCSRNLQILWLDTVHFSLKTQTNDKKFSPNKLAKNKWNETYLHFVKNNCCVPNSQVIIQSLYA